MLEATQSKPGNRLERFGRAAVRRKPEGGPRELTARHKLLIDYQVSGCGHADICKRIIVERKVLVDGMPATVRRHPELHEPLNLEEAADLLRIRRRNARDLATRPIYRQAYEAELQRYRSGEKAASLRTMVAVRDDPGLGKAADRKVRLEASKALIGEEAGAGLQVNVGVAIGTKVQPGIVVRRYQPREPGADTKIIQHEARAPGDALVDG